MTPLVIHRPWQTLQFTSIIHMLTIISKNDYYEVTIECQQAYELTWFFEIFKIAAYNYENYKLSVRLNDII